MIKNCLTRTEFHEELWVHQSSTRNHITKAHWNYISIVFVRIGVHWWWGLRNTKNRVFGPHCWLENKWQCVIYECTHLSFFFFSVVIAPLFIGSSLLSISSAPVGVLFCARHSLDKRWPSSELTQVMIWRKNVSFEFTVWPFTPGLCLVEIEKFLEDFWGKFSFINWEFCLCEITEKNWVSWVGCSVVESRMVKC